jgi:hypothetical protein
MEKVMWAADEKLIINELGPHAVMVEEHQTNWSRSIITS